MEEILYKLIIYMIIFAIIFFPVIFFIKYFIIRRILGFKSTSLKTTGATIKGSGLKRSKNPKGFVFGKQNGKEVFLSSDKEGHIVVFGRSGDGKTSSILVPTLRVWDGSFFAIDISGDISDNVNVSDKIILNPDDVNESCYYDIFYDIDKEEDFHDKKEKLERLVNLIIDIPPKTGDVQLYFLSTARKILYGSMLAFYDIGMDFIDICKTVFFNDTVELIKLVKNTQNELAIGYMEPLLKENEKNIGGAKATLNEKIKLFADNEKISKIIGRMSHERRDKETLYPKMIEAKKIFLKIPDNKQEYYSLFMRLVLGQMLEYISGRKYTKGIDKRILLAVDEFASIGYLELLGPFRKFRKNGANICILTQSVPDIDLVYSERERQVILDNSKYIAVFSAVDYQTREYFSNLVGKKDVEKKSVSKGVHGESESVSVQREYIIQPEEWKNIDDYLVVIHPSGYCRLKKNPYYKHKVKEKKAC